MTSDDVLALQTAIARIQILHRRPPTSVLVWLIVRASDNPAQRDQRQQHPPKPFMIHCLLLMWVNS